MSKPPLKLERSRRFEKDYAKLAEKIPKIRAELIEIIDQLLQRQPLNPRHRDHALKGNLKELRDCHVRGDCEP